MGLQLTALLENQLGHWPKFQKLHIYTLSTPVVGGYVGGGGGQNQATGSMCLRYGKICKTVIFGHETWPLAKNSKVAHILSLYPRGSSTPEGRNWAYFPSTGSGFQDTGWFSKLPYLGMKLSHWPKSRSFTYTLSNLGGWNWAYFRSTGSGFQNTGRFSKLPYLGMKLGHWPKFQKLKHILSSPKGSKLSLFSLYGQRFLKHRPIFKIAILGHETWPLAKVPEVVHIFFLPQEVKLSLFSLYGQRLPRYIFNIAIFGHETWPLAKVPEVVHIPESCIWGRTCIWSRTNIGFRQIAVPSFKSLENH